MPPTHEADEAPRTPNRQPVRPSSYQRRGKKAERKLSKEKEKNRFLTTRVDYAARSSSYNGGQQERGTVVMDKRVSLSRSFSSQFGVGPKGEKPTAAGASESKRWIERKHFVPFSLLFYLCAPLSSSLCLSCPLNEVAKTLSETGRGSSLRSLPRKNKHYFGFKTWVSF